MKMSKRKSSVEEMAKQSEEGYDVGEILRRRAAEAAVLRTNDVRLEGVK
jgi:hypothetical protein